MLNQFLTGVEKRAYRMALFAIKDVDSALDIVQDAMLDFVRRYRDKPEIEWPALFFRVVQSRITDAHRRRNVRNRILAWLGKDWQGDEAEDPLENMPDHGAVSPLRSLERKALGTALERAVDLLPLRQQQAFLLRSWEGLDVAETAHAMGCSAGSVKTHYFRAVQALRKELEEFEP